MKKRSKEPQAAPRIGMIAGAAAILAATAWAFYAPHHPEDNARGPMRTIADQSGPVGPAQASGAIAPDAGSPPSKPSLLEPAMIDPIPQKRSESPLIHSPGYYPPDDPESTSVITGRRDAPLVSLELDGGASSKEDLAHMLLAAISAKDEHAMHELRVTHNEFQTICWPEFPESRPVTHITANDAWLFSITKSMAGARSAVGSYGGRTLELVRVVSLPPFAYKNFNLYREVTIVARDYGSRQEVRLKFMPSIVERHGRYKALLFRD